MCYWVLGKSWVSENSHLTLHIRKESQSRCGTSASCWMIIGSSPMRRCALSQALLQPETRGDRQPSFGLRVTHWGILARWGSNCLMFRKQVGPGQGRSQVRGPDPKGRLQCTRGKGCRSWTPSGRTPGESEPSGSTSTGPAAAPAGKCWPSPAGA